jgi:hemerythrin-like metal-binding protein
MRTTQWHSDSNTGIEAIDHEHRQLGAAIDTTCASLRARPAPGEVLEGLGLLYERAAAHCALEERLLCDCDRAARQRAAPQHHGLLENIAQMMDAFYEGNCETCDKTLEACLQAWFEQHLQGEHRQMAVQSRNGLCS